MAALATGQRGLPFRFLEEDDKVRGARRRFGDGMQRLGDGGGPVTTATERTGAHGSLL
jgi:hypothetical protein